MSWTLTKKLAQKRSKSPKDIKSREVVLGYRERDGLLLLQLFPNGGATDIVFMTLFCIAVGTAIAWCGGRCAMPDGHCLKNLVVPAAVHGSLGLPGWRLFRGFTLLSPFSHSSPSLTMIGLLASVDVKQQKLILSHYISLKLKTVAEEISSSSLISFRIVSCTV